MQPFTVQSRPFDVRFDKGKHHRGRIGFILMSTDLAAESDYFAMAPEDVGIHITRLDTQDVTTNDTLAEHINTMASAAARLQPDNPPDIISYVCTSGSIINGEAAVVAEIERGAPNSTGTTLVTGVIAALRALGAERLAVATPYIDEINQREADFLAEKGFDVVTFQGLQLDTGVEFGRVAPDYWIEVAEQVDHPDADAIFLSCSGIRAVEVIDRIEARLNKPVVTSNQANMWACLRKIGVQDQIGGFGRLFDLSLES